jgi:ATP-dependent DNA helicase RecG
MSESLRTEATLPGRLRLRLKTPQKTALVDLPGVGPRTARRLVERGMADQLDLLLHVPRGYRLTARFCTGQEILEGRPGFVEAVGTVTHLSRPRHSRAPFEVHVDVDGAPFRLLWFRLPFKSFDRAFEVGALVHFEGAVDFERGGQLAHPTAKVVRSIPTAVATTELEPIYSSIEGVGESLLAKSIAIACDALGPHLVEGVPQALLNAQDLPGIEEALRVIHVRDRESDPEVLAREVRRARDRLIYQEFFELQQALTHRYVAERRVAKAPRCTKREIGRAFVRGLPFKLTGDQRRAIRTIADELESAVPMRRLLQGDVGSGKTVVALMAAAIAVENGVQVALMAPTDILARQHLRRVEEFFAELDVARGHLASGQSAAERRETLEGLASGEIQLVVGTHALFQQGVRFQRLGLIIIDEEHKFGVDQRQALLSLGRDPHLLSMTATPIPRTLAHAVFGDRDLTLIREKPPYRTPIRTVLRDRSRAGRMYAYLKKRIEGTGQQAYIVFPLVLASDAVAHRRSVVEGAEELAGGPLRGLRLGVLHGRMSPEEKDAVMRRFAAGELDVLCATTVIEVGVDVANATVMVIENAEAFGLSQLHQLRGRVGRGAADSLCVLLTGGRLTDDAALRLKAMVETDDGFALAEADLALRGPGEFLGQKQAGLAEFRFGDVLRDADLLLTARADARRLLLGDVSG